MPIFSTLFLGLLVLFSETVFYGVAALPRWFSGCLMSIFVGLAIVATIIGVFLFGAFLFNL